MNSEEKKRVIRSQKYLQSVVNTIEKIDLTPIASAIEILELAWLQNKHVFVIGNGGSAATASHIGVDLMKTTIKYLKEGKGFKVIPLTDNVPIITAIANDISYNLIFSQVLEVLANSGDVLLLISGSGNSPNLIAACDIGEKIGMKMIGFLGQGGGKIKDRVDAAIVVPSDEYGPIEDIHMILDHLLTDYFQYWFASRKSVITRDNPE